MIVRSLDAKAKEQGAALSLLQLTPPEYSEMLAMWEECEDCFAGEHAVKAKGERYIHRPASKMGSERSWEAYIGRGKFPSLPGKTLGKMIGILSSKTPSAVFEGKAKKLDFMLEYATPMRDGLDSLFKRVVENVLRYGRYCLLLEPDNNDAIGFHINEYKARKFLRARVHDSDGESYAETIILDTSSVEFDTDVWRDVYRPQITVLALANPNGIGERVYYQAVFQGGGNIVDGYTKSGARIYRNHDNYESNMSAVMSQLEQFRIGDPDERLCSILITPDKYGKTLDRIPFTCINSSSLNFMRFERPPMLSLCNQCIHILNADCDHQNAIFLTTDPTPVIRGCEEGDNAKAIRPGSDNVMLLGGNRIFEYVSSNGAGIEAQASNIDRMVAEAKDMGVSLAGTENIGNTPVGTMTLYRNSQVADLQTINQTCGKGIEEQLRYAGKWIGMDEEERARDISYTPSSEFADIKATALECSNIAAGVKSGNMPMTQEEVRKFLEKNGIVDVRPWEEVKEELEEEKADSEERQINSVAGAFGFDQNGTGKNKPNETSEAGNNE